MGAGILGGGPISTDPKGLTLNLPTFPSARPVPIAGQARKYGG